MPRLVEQIRQVVAAFADIKTKPALIGGLALAAHQVVRATRDVDFLVDADDADRLHEILLGLGYRCIHRSEDAANYLRDDEGVDLLYAHRATARRLLAQASERVTIMGPLRVVSAEGLIGLSARCCAPSAAGSTYRKCRNTSRCSIAGRCWVNSLPKSPTTRVDRVSEPFAGGEVVSVAQPGRGDLSDWVEVMEAVEALCPVWPVDNLRVGRDYRL